MWRWHAVEEVEHKGVAYDTWLHATRDWSGWKAWKVRSLTMLLVTARFFKNRWADTIELLAQDGITGWKARWGLVKYLTVSPGVVRRIFPAWLSLSSRVSTRGTMTTASSRKWKANSKPHCCLRVINLSPEKPRYRLRGAGAFSVRCRRPQAARGSA